MIQIWFFFFSSDISFLVLYYKTSSNGDQSQETEHWNENTKKVQKNCQRLKSTFYVIFSKFLTVCRIAPFEIFFKCWIIMPIWGKYCTRKNPKNWTLLWILGHCGRARVAMVACFLCNTQKLACCWTMSQWNIPDSLE